MSYKEQLQTNNENLQVLIDKANSLPDAGGGDVEFETWILTLEDGSTIEKVVYVE